MITVGQDSYVTVKQADDYVDVFYVTSSATSIRWKALSDTDKEVHLRQACIQLDRLPFIMCKKSSEQPLQFPRGDQAEVPKAIQQAQIEQALYISDPSITSDMDYRQALQRQGVKSFSIGKLSESYGGAGVSAATSAAEAALSGYALSWASPWIARCFRFV